jgi:hypothetical protein
MSTQFYQQGDTMLTMQTPDFLVEIDEGTDIYLEDKRAGTARYIEWTDLPNEEEICNRLAELSKAFNYFAQFQMT